MARSDDLARLSARTQQAEDHIGCQDAGPEQIRAAVLQARDDTERRHTSSAASTPEPATMKSWANGVQMSRVRRSGRARCLRV